MAGVSIKTIKSRIKSVESTMQITRAMELVSSSKLRKAKEKALNVQPVQDILIETLSSMQKDIGASGSVFFAEHNGKKCCYVIIAGDRGLAGGYNNNLFREVTRHSAGSDISVLPIGKKAMEYYKSHGHDVVSEKYDLTAEITMGSCYQISRDLIEKFVHGEIDCIYLAYNRFRSILVQEPVIETVLPVPKSEPSEKSPGLTIYEPSIEEALDAAVFQYVSTYLYCAVCEAAAAEHAARRNSMNAANKNGAQMIEDMKLQYNRARQAAITQELTEIVAGAEAL